MKKSSGSLWLRLLCLALCLVMVFSLGACGSEKEATDDEEETTSAKQDKENDTEPGEAPEATPEPQPTPEPAPVVTPTVETLAIYGYGDPIKDNDCTLRVGEPLPLSVYATPGGIAGQVEWSIDPVSESCFVLTTSESDPYRAELKAFSVLPVGAGGARVTANFYGASASIVVHVVAGDGGVTTLQKPDENLTVAIHVSRGDANADSLTISPDYEKRLRAVPLKGGKAEDVKWSMSEEAEKVLCFTESTAHPGEMILECFDRLPDGVNFVEIYAELDGVKTTCVVYITEPQN